MKKIFALVVLAAVTFTVVGCGSAASTGPRPTTVGTVPVTTAPK